MREPELSRTIGLVDSIVIVIGTVIGSAIFLVPNSVAASLPAAPSILLVWTMTGVLSFFGALAFAELGAMMPDTGGQYVYLREAYGPLVGFVSGWALFLVIQTGSLATLAAGFAIYLAYFIPMTAAEARLASVLLIAVLTIVNYRGVRLGVGVQRLFTFLKLAGLAIIVASAFVAPRHALPAPDLPAAFSWSRFGVAMIACLWAYEGWNSLSFVAGEVRRPSRNLPLALGIGTALLIAIYITANVAYMRMLSVPEIAATSRVAARSAEISIGPAGATLVALTILVSIIGASNGSALTSARIYFAQARDGLFFSALGRVHPRFGTPHVAIAVQGAWAAVLAVSGSYERLFSYVVFTAWIFYGMAALAVIVLRRRWPDRPRPYRMWGYPVTPLLFSGVAFWFVGNTILTTPGPSLIGLAIVATGIPAYWFWARQRGVQTSSTRASLEGQP
jgi:APA family basic amino acid/polyamine antiporter